MGRDSPESLDPGLRLDDVPLSVIAGTAVGARRAGAAAHPRSLPQCVTTGSSM